MIERKGTLIVGDLHIDEKSIDEVREIVNEICDIQAKRLIQLGDLCHNNRLNARELDFLTWVAYRFKSSFEEVHFITGNHDLLDNNISIITYLKYLGITIHDTDEAYIGGSPQYKGRFSSAPGPILAGHFFTDKSKDAFGKYKYTLKQLQNAEDIKGIGFHCCFLGHQHDFQVLDENQGIYHLGSARFVSFAEDKSLKKKVAWLHEGKLEFIDLKSTISILDVHCINDLLNLNARTKVRYIFSSFDQLKNEISELEKYKTFFYQFKIKLQFKDKINKVENKTEKSDIKDFVSNWLKSISDNEVRNILEEEFVREIK